MTRQIDSALNGAPVSADGGVLPTISRALMVAQAGDVTVTFAGSAEAPGRIVTLPALQPGVVYPVQIARVMAEGTTARGLVALW